MPLNIDAKRLFDGEWCLTGYHLQPTGLNELKPLSALLGRGTGTNPTALESLLIALGGANWSARLLTDWGLLITDLNDRETWLALKNVSTVFCFAQRVKDIDAAVSNTSFPRTLAIHRCLKPLERKDVALFQLAGFEVVAQDGWVNTEFAAWSEQIGDALDSWRERYPSINGLWSSPEAAISAANALNAISSLENEFGFFLARAVFTLS